MFKAFAWGALAAGALFYVSCNVKVSTPNLERPMKAGEYEIDIPLSGKIFEGQVQIPAIKIGPPDYDVPSNELTIRIGCDSPIIGTAVEELACLGQKIGDLKVTAFEYKNEDITVEFLRDRLHSAKSIKEYAAAGLAALAAIGTRVIENGGATVRYRIEIPSLPKTYLIATKLPYGDVGAAYVYVVVHFREKVAPVAAPIQPPPPGPRDVVKLRAFNQIGEVLVVGNIFFFSADDGASGMELWKSDGTAAGTVIVKDICQGTCSSASIYLPYNLTNVNGVVFFGANDGLNGHELWRSDGTTVGTVMVKDIYPGAQGSGPRWLTSMNGVLFLQATDGSHGYELWKSDGTAAGTVMVRDLNAESSFPSFLTNVNGRLFFAANTGSSMGIELLKSDGTAAGISLVKDIWPGTLSSSPDYLINLNGMLLFRANDGINGNEPWKSYGTAAGTIMLKDIWPGSTGGSMYYPTNVNGSVFFIAQDGVHGGELWKTDGMAAGTTMVKDIRPGIAGAWPSPVTNINGVAYFSANDGTNGIELWKSDGTAAGTLMVKDINAGASSSNPYLFTNVNGTAFFLATDSANGGELWKTDGTVGGTMLVRDIRSGSAGSYPRMLINYNGSLIFAASDGTPGVGLFKY
ncbi:MAG: hypothetical protein HY537_08365 [Deltaproteobacteria bacterium]|nr:hypothetical protein [Deltaproteobacteria bacterium]